MFENFHVFLFDFRGRFPKSFQHRARSRRQRLPDRSVPRRVFVFCVVFRQSHNLQISSSTSTTVREILGRSGTGGLALPRTIVHRHWIHTLFRRKEVLWAFDTCLWWTRFGRGGIGGDNFSRSFFCALSDRQRLARRERIGFLVGEKRNCQRGFVMIIKSDFML